MKKLLYVCLGLQLIACAEKQPESREIREYHANGKVKSIGNYQGDTSAEYIHRSGLQFFETYQIDEIAGQLAQSGLYGFMTAGNGPIIGYVSLKGKRDINSLMEKSDFKQAFPQDLKFCWGAEMSVEPGGPKEPRYLLYAVKNPQKQAVTINGQDLAEALVNEEEQTIDLQMTARGAEKLQQMTGDNINKFLAIVIDDAVFSAPRVMQTISEGKVSISGDFSEVVVHKLVKRLNEDMLNGEFRTYDEQGKLLHVRNYVKGERVASQGKK